MNPRSTVGILPCIGGERHPEPRIPDPPKLINQRHEPPFTSFYHGKDIVTGIKTQLISLRTNGSYYRSHDNSKKDGEEMLEL